MLNIKPNFAQERALNMLRHDWKNISVLHDVHAYREW